MKQTECKICNGTKHVYSLVEGVRRVFPCECLVKQKAAQILERFEVSSQPLERCSVLNGKLVFPQTKEAQHAMAIRKKFELNQPLKHQIVLDLARGVKQPIEMLAFIILAMKGKDIKIIDLQDYSDAVFRNEKMTLEQVTVLKSTLSLTKNLRGKFIQDLTLKAQIEDKMLIYMFDNFSMVKDESPELVSLFDHTLIVPDYAFNR